MSGEDRRMIEYEMPLDAIDYSATKEKKHPRRYVEMIHQWPSRKPRGATRAAIAAALMRVPADQASLKARLALLADLAPYECSSSVLNKARTIIRAENGGTAPKVLDLFAGGGAIPLEAANLGCEAHAVELNSVAHIVQLATCVYPQRYGKRLATLVEKWGNWVTERARREVGALYPRIRIESKAQAQQLAFAQSGSGALSGSEVEPIAYLWSRTVPCVDRNCGATVPLASKTWLCRKDGKAVALKVALDRNARRVRYDIAAASNVSDLGFDPGDMSDRGDTECPFCRATISADAVKALGRGGKIGVQLMAVAGTLSNERGRVYVPADAAHLPTEGELEGMLASFGEDWPGPAALPLAPEYTGGSCVPYGMDKFYKLFTSRQAVALLTFSRAIREVFAEILKEVADPELATAVVTILALTLDKLTGYLSTLTIWDPEDQVAKHTFGKQALPMMWDFAEVNPFANVAGSFTMNLKAELECVQGLASVGRPVERCIRANAMSLPYGNATFDAIVTDPPYYDMISYADLSDFFFVWLKRTLGERFPEHLDGDQTAKKQEAAVIPYRHGGDVSRARQHFEGVLSACFVEAGRVLKAGAPLVVVYAHKTVAGWSTLVDALRNAGCFVCEAWPLATNSQNKWGAGSRAAMLITSIFLVARKRSSEAACNDYDAEIAPEAEQIVDERVKTLWAFGLTGADLVIAVIGAALAPFTRYTSVRRSNGAEVTTAEFLEEAQRATLEAILKQVIRDAGGKDVSVAAIDPISRLYVVSRLQFGDAPAEYDVFKNLAIGALPPGTELDGMKGALMAGKRALLAKKGAKVSLRGFEDRGGERELGLPLDGKAPPLVDVLHRLLWLQKHRSADVGRFVEESRADMGAVRLLAQALGGRPLRAEPVPGAQKDERTGEQRAVDTLLASFQDLTRAASAGPLFDRATRGKA